MEIIYKRGNILEGPIHTLIHCTNARGKFASGIAGQIRQRWPHVYNAYMEKYRTEGWAVGDFQRVPTDDISPVYVINLCGQKDYGYDGKQHVSWLGVRIALQQIFYFQDRDFPGQSLSLPLLGCGLAGGKKEDLIHVIGSLRAEWPNYNFNVEIYEL